MAYRNPQLPAGIVIEEFKEGINILKPLSSLIDLYCANPFIMLPGIKSLNYSIKCKISEHKSWQNIDLIWNLCKTHCYLDLINFNLHKASLLFVQFLQYTVLTSHNGNRQHDKAYLVNYTCPTAKSKVNEIHKLSMLFLEIHIYFVQTLSWGNHLMFDTLRLWLQQQYILRDPWDKRHKYCSFCKLKCWFVF